MIRGIYPHSDHIILFKENHTDKELFLLKNGLESCVILFLNQNIITMLFVSRKFKLRGKTTQLNIRIFYQNMYLFLFYTSHGNLIAKRNSLMSSLYLKIQDLIFVS